MRHVVPPSGTFGRQGRRLIEEQSFRLIPCLRPPPALLRRRRPCRRRSIRRRTKRRRCCQWRRYRRRSTSMRSRPSTAGASRRTTRATTRAPRGARPRATRTARTRSPTSRRDARCVGRGRKGEEEGWITPRRERAPIMMICVCPPSPSPFARALGAMERGQLPREIDVEMLRGPIYGPKAKWPAPFSSWAGRWSKKRAGDAPASSVETDGGGATATSAARAAIAELLRAAAGHVSRHAAGSEMPRGRPRKSPHSP